MASGRSLAAIVDISDQIVKSKWRLIPHTGVDQNGLRTPDEYNVLSEGTSVIVAVKTSVKRVA